GHVERRARRRTGELRRRSDFRRLTCCRSCRREGRVDLCRRAVALDWRCRWCRRHGGAVGGLVILEELLPALGDRRWIRSVTLVHLVDEPGIGAKGTFLGGHLGSDATERAALPFPIRG